MSAELVSLLKKDPAKVIETAKSSSYSEAVFKDVHNTAMQLPTQSAEWKALRNANFYEFYQTVLLSDNFKISVGLNIGEKTQITHAVLSLPLGFRWRSFRSTTINAT
jgi:hypothetical protein